VFPDFTACFPNIKAWLMHSPFLEFAEFCSLMFSIQQPSFKSYQNRDCKSNALPIKGWLLVLNMA
jgi:hypothetical protein